MPDTFPSSVPAPDFSSKKSVKPRILENDFGDGYTQRAADGLNSMRREWDVSWTNLTLAEKNTLITFFEAQQGYKSFFWTAPGDTAQRKWTVREWRETPVVANNWTIQAQFRQEFDL